jgi:hypothetical protein
VSHAIGRSTVYDYLYEGIGVLADQAPSLQSALLAAKMDGYAHVNIDGTVIETDRCRTPGPTPGVDLWWSAKCDNHGGNVQVITAPDGWPLWTSDVRPGREHDTSALREHREALPLLTTWTAEHLRVLGDLGYEGEADTITVAYKKPKDGHLSEVQKTFNKAHNGLRAIGERGNSLLKPHSRPCATSASAHGRSARSLQPHSYSCTSNRTALPDHPEPRTVTRKGSFASSAASAMPGGQFLDGRDHVIWRWHLGGFAA